MNTESLQQEYPNINRLKFSNAIEQQFHEFRLQSFLDINPYILLFASVAYLSFLVSDYLIVSEQFFTGIAVSRIIIAGIVFLSFYTTSVLKNCYFRQNIFVVISALIILISAHICISSYFLPKPMSEIYLMGLVQLYIVIPAVLKPHTKVCLITMGLVLTCLIISLVCKQSIPIDTSYPLLDQLINGFAYSFPIFILGLMILSSYLAYSYEKMLRKSWLDSQMTMIKNHNLEEMTIKLRELSHIDELTNLANRRSFKETLAEELSKLHLSAKPISLLMLDVDNFKAYNDIYGHQAGDDCLKQIAICLKESCQRSVDVPARYGGEEFMVVLPNTDAQGAQYLANEIRQYIENLNIEHTGSNYGMVTVSIGTTTILTSHEIDVERLIKRADDALYMAKNQGRNQVVAFKDFNKTEHTTP